MRRNQGVAVDPQHARAEGELQRPQRIPDDILATCVMHRRVFLLGDEAVHVLDADPPQPVPSPDRDMLPGLARPGHRAAVLRQIREAETLSSRSLCMRLKCACH